MVADISAIRGPIAPLDPAAMADRDAALQLCRTYALAIDTKNEEMLRSLFDPKAKMKGTLSAALAEDYLPRLLVGVRNFAATMHTILNQYAVIEGDTGRVCSYAIAYHIHDPSYGLPHLLMGIEYRDKVSRAPTGWWIVEREVVRIWEVGPHAPPA